jgi:hypothetical protein
MYYRHKLENNTMYQKFLPQFKRNDNLCRVLSDCRQSLIGTSCPFISVFHLLTNVADEDIFWLPYVAALLRNENSTEFSINNIKCSMQSFNYSKANLIENPGTMKRRMYTVGSELKKIRTTLKLLNISGMVQLKGGFLLYSITLLEKSLYCDVGGVPTTTSRDLARFSRFP